MHLKKVKGTFSIFLAVAFLAMQMLSFQHMVEHGFKDHDHAGHHCEIVQYFHLSQSFDSAANEPALTVVPQIYITVAQDFNQTETISSFPGFTLSPRAPPLPA